MAVRPGKTVSHAVESAETNPLRSGERALKEGAGPLIGGVAGCLRWLLGTLGRVW